jgi:hypothetical protein
VMPGTYKFPRSDKGVMIQLSSPLPRYRTVRLVSNDADAREAKYTKWRQELERVKSIFEVQIMVERAPMMELNSKDFNYFIHLCAAKSHRLLQAENGFSKVTPIG